MKSRSKETATTIGARRVENRAGSKAGNATFDERDAGEVTSGEQVLSQDAPTHREIELRAYEIYLSKGAFDGRALDDWLRAERDLLDETTGNSAN